MISCPCFYSVAMSTRQIRFWTAQLIIWFIFQALTLSLMAKILLSIIVLNYGMTCFQLVLYRLTIIARKTPIFICQKLIAFTTSKRSWKNIFYSNIQVMMMILFTINLPYYLSLSSASWKFEISFWIFFLVNGRKLSLTYESSWFLIFLFNHWSYSVEISILKFLIFLFNNESS